MLWFSHFSGTADLEHGHGAKALSQYAFLNRDICWEELEWKGKHGQSPAMVATKPHYFLDLDVQRTVENFLEYVPQFWSSNEFSDSLKDGSILSIDMKFFVNLFIDLMYKEDLEVWDIIEQFLKEQSFSFLCHHLLIILEEMDFCHFLDLMPKYLKPRSEPVVHGDQYQWFEILLAKYSDCRTIDELLLLNAVTNQGRQLIRLVNEEGSDEEKEKIKNFVSQLCESSSCFNDLAPIIESENKPFKLIKTLGVQSWVIMFKLSEEFRSPESWESLFTSNGIKFCTSNKYALLLDDDISEDYGSDIGGKSSKGRKAKEHKKRRKKRRRDFDSAGSYEDERDDFNSVNDRQCLQNAARDWLLSTDDYSTTWSSVSSQYVQYIPPILSSAYAMIYSVLRLRL